MFDDYSTQQLLNLRSLCADVAVHSGTAESRANALSVVKFIDEELMDREQKKSA